jgi:hypothetical protein
MRKKKSCSFHNGTLYVVTGKTPLPGNSLKKNGCFREAA